VHKDIDITSGGTTSQTNEDDHKQDQYRSKSLKPRSVHARVVAQRNGRILDQWNISRLHIHHLKIGRETRAGPIPIT
jgi:hypothetical protein